MSFVIIPRMAKLEVIGLRDRVCRSIRRYFHGKGFIEVQTPVCLDTPALEDFIDAQPCGDKYLRTSPELHMKRMLCAGASRIFQIGPCFRKGEKGRLHNPEFTMLEWYRTEAGYMDILLDTRELLTGVVKETTGGGVIKYGDTSIDIAGPWDCLSVSEAFLMHAGWDPLKAFDQDRFDLDLISKVEPGLPKDKPVVLKDYPAEAAALSLISDNPVRHAERFEIYIGGLELANAFSELTDAAEQRKRFMKCAEFRAGKGMPVYPLDEKFLHALEGGMPRSAGIALGLDRFLMLLADADDISEVIYH